MHPAFIILIFYYSMSCMVVTWAGFNVGMERVQEVEYAEDFDRGDWVKWFILTFFVWPMMVPELVKDTRAIIRKMSPYPRCLRCGSPEVIKRTPRARKMASEKDKQWRKAELKRRGLKEGTSYIGDRGKEESPWDYNRYLERFEREPWGDCQECGKQLDRKEMEKIWT